MENNNYKIERIVIVEDDSGLNKLLQKKLEVLGFEIIGFTSGESALEFLNDNQDVLLLIDYHLSDMLALELINEFLERKIKVPFIVMTGKGDEKLAVEIMRLGALDYIVKEVGFYKNLNAIITRALSHFDTKRKLVESQKEIALNEEKYRSIFENITDIYFETDIEGVISEISPSVENILQYKRDVLIDKDIASLFADKINGKEFLASNLDKGGLIDYETILIDKDKNNKYCSITSNLQTINDGSKKIVGIIRDVSLRKKLENQILNQVIETEEKERKRFSEDLHDGLGPLLSSIKLYVNMIINPDISEEKKQNLKNYTNELIDEAISNTRAIANNLMPNVLNDFGLIKAIESFIHKINITDKLEISFNSNIVSRLEPNIEITIYRTILELIHNTIKHANAKKIIIDLQLVNQTLKIKYVDNGIGFDLHTVQNIKNNQGNGLRNIANRVKSLNAIMNLRSEKDKGVEVSIELNLENYINNQS